MDSREEAPVRTGSSIDLDPPVEAIAAKPTVTVFKPTTSSVRSPEPRQPTPPAWKPTESFETPTGNAEEINPLDKRFSHAQTPSASGQVPSAGQPLTPGKRITF